jgi:hypothetical protein
LLDETRARPIFQFAGPGGASWDIRSNIGTLTTMFALSIEAPVKGVATLVDPGRAVAPLPLLYDLDTGLGYIGLRLRSGSRVLECRAEGFSAETGLGALFVPEITTTLPFCRPSCRLKVGERVVLSAPWREAFGSITRLEPVPRLQPYERRFRIFTDIVGWPEAMGAPLLDRRGQLLGICLSVSPVVACPSEWLAVGGARDRLGWAMRTRTWRDACDIVANLLSEETRHDPELLAAAGSILEHLDQREGACAYYAAAANDDPDNAWTRYRVGQCLSHLGRRADAQRWLQQAVRLDPSNREYRRALEEASDGGH